MMELKNDTLVVRFPEIHHDAVLVIGFQRTLRIPDDDRTYPLPPGLGHFPLRHVDDFAEKVPAEWVEHGGVMLPMYQSEAMWLNFTSLNGYPFAVRVAAGKIDAVTGESLAPGLVRRPQNYLSIPEQPWLDGFCVGKGVIRQFVAMPLGSGYSAEEQITGKAEFGGLQIIVYPLKASKWEEVKRQMRFTTGDFPGMAFSQQLTAAAAPIMDMGLAPGGRMKQDISRDPFKLTDWDQSASSRCFVHLANSLMWRTITGGAPPTLPPTAAEYTKAGLPWFDYYAESGGVQSWGVLDKLKSVMGMAKEKGEQPLPENEAVHPVNVVHLRRGLRKEQVREGSF